MEKTEQRVFKTIEAALGVNAHDLSRNQLASDIEGWDSLSHVTIMLMLSREFSIPISAEDAEAFDNISDLIDYIDSKILAE